MCSAEDPCPRPVHLKPVLGTPNHFIFCMTSLFNTVVLKPVLGTPNHFIFCMSPSFNTPDSTHQLVSIEAVSQTEGYILCRSHPRRMSLTLTLMSCSRLLHIRTS